MLRTQSFLVVSLLTATLALAACATKPPSDVVMTPGAAPAEPASAQAEPPAAGSPPAAQAAATTPPPAAAPKRRQAAAGRAARAPEEPSASRTDDGLFTITKAREQCWMKYETEKAGRGLDLDKKAVLVQKCVDDKMKTSIGR